MNVLKIAIRKNRLVAAVFLYLACMYILHTIKPAIIYNEHGGFRPFGLGYRHKTVIPIWVVSIILALFCYMAINMV
jgi:hypothetical protein